MSQLTITVDGDTVMDADPGDFTLNPPELVTDQLKANARPAVWMRAMAIVIADAAMSRCDTSINVTTRFNGWDLSVWHR